MTQAPHRGTYHPPGSLLDENPGSTLNGNQQHRKERGLINAYGWIYTEWAKADKPYAELLLPLLLQHAAQNGIISKGESRVERDRSGLLSIKDVCKERGSSFATVKRQLTQLSLIPKGTRPGVRAAICRPALDSLKSLDEAKSLGMRSIGSLLGVGRGCARELVEIGLLGSVGNSVRDVDVIDFIGQLKERCGSNPPQGLISLRDASRQRNIRLAVLISEIVHRKLKAWAYNPANNASVIDTILVDATSISPIRSVPMPLAEAANLLSIHPEALGQLVNCGVIKRQNGRGLDPAVVGEFGRQYMAIGRLSARFKTSPRVLREQLSGLGVEPTFSPPEYRQIIYERAKAEPLLRELWS